MSLDTSTLTQTFSGEVISPESTDYDSVRNAFSGAGSPALVLRPRTTQDVAMGIQFARDHSLTLSVRSGGHHGAAFGTNDGGMVIDLTHLNSVDLYDSANHLVRIGGGAHWGDVADTLHQHGLAISSGDTKSVGVGGLTLGGGVGWIVRKWGLAIDQLVGAQIVTADGSVLHVSDSENADVFWAIRGGGGNIGIVTQFEFAAHPLSDVYFGTIKFSADNVRDTLTKWRACIDQSPLELTASLSFMPSFAPEMPPSIMLSLCYAGDDQVAAMTAIEPFKQIGSITSEDISKKPYAEILEEVHPPQGMKMFVSNIFTDDLSDDLVEKTSQLYDRGGWVIQIRSIGGALNTIAADATAFAHRDSTFMLFAGTFVPAASPASELAEAAKPWADIASFGRGSYANFLSTRTDDDTAAIYPASTYQKLRGIKSTYDPENIFDQNYNVKPAN